MQVKTSLLGPQDKGAPVGPSPNQRVHPLTDASRLGTLRAAAHELGPNPSPWTTRAA